MQIGVRFQVQDTKGSSKTDAEVKKMHWSCLDEEDTSTSGFMYTGVGAKVRTEFWAWFKEVVDSTKLNFSPSAGSFFKMLHAN